MYTILIVDDEEPVIESYSFILESGVENFRLAGTARSGPEAIARIHELKPDVVFMDINMPGLDGLEAIERVHDYFPGTVFVLSTAYERFDLACRAIPLGIFKYLVKPVTRKTFLETLDAVRVEICKRRSGRVSPDSGLRTNKFLSETIWKELGPEQSLAIRESLGLESDGGFVCFVGLDSEQENLFVGINAALELKFRFLFTIHLNLGMYFFPCPVDKEAADAFLERTLKDCVPAGVLCIVGSGSVRSGTELHLSCTEALSELQKRRDSTDVRIRERLRVIQIRRKMGLSDCEEVRALFSEYWSEIFASYSFEMAKAKMAAFFSLLIDDATGCYQSHSDTAVPFDPAEEIMGLEDLAAWKDWSLATFNRIYTMTRGKRTGQFPVPLVRALAFIETSFERQIQLSEVADAAHVSTAYLSKLFSDHLGSTFVDYLTEIRVGHAEQLIRENRLTVKEVAYAVGYQDPNYFSKIFRKTVGMSPSMYAERSRYGNQNY